MKFTVALSRRKVISLIFVLTIVGASFYTGFQYALAQSGSLTAQTLSGGVLPGAPSYTIFQDGGTYYAKDSHGAISFTSTNATSVGQSALDNAASGSVLFKAGNYGTISLTANYNESINIEPGVNNGFTIIVGSTFTGLINDARTGTLTIAQGGSSSNLYMNKQLAGSGSQIYDFITLRNNNNTGDFSGLMLSPNGNGYHASSNWTTSIQLANTDIKNDSANFEMMEMTWENNYAYINVYKMGTGHQRDFSILLDANLILKAGYGQTGVYGKNGQYFLYLFRPLGFTFTGMYPAPLNLVNLGVGPGSSGNPCHTPAMICYIPQATVLAAGWTTFNIYNDMLSGASGSALVFSNCGGADDPLQFQISSLAKDNSGAVANQLQIQVYANNMGGNYTTQAPITLYVELRY